MPQLSRFLARINRPLGLSEVLLPIPLSDLSLRRDDIPPGKPRARKQQEEAGKEGLRGQENGICSCHEIMPKWNEL